MYYRKFAVAPHLSTFVECYFVWEKHEVLLHPLRIESPPTGFASMMFNYGDAYKVGNNKYESAQVPATFLTGQSTQSYTLDLSGKIGMVGIVFKPAGLSSLFELPMYEFSDERINLVDVLGKGLQSLHEQILEANSPTARICLLEQFLNRQLLKKGNLFDRTDYAANLIVDRKGAVNVGELMNDLYICRRQFERQFLYKIGVSPK